MKGQRYGKDFEKGSSRRYEYDLKSGEVTGLSLTPGMRNDRRDAGEILYFLQSATVHDRKFISALPLLISAFYSLNLTAMVWRLCRARGVESGTFLRYQSSIPVNLPLESNFKSMSLERPISYP
jgi:hypothetical protein